MGEERSDIEKGEGRGRRDGELGRTWRERSRRDGERGKEELGGEMYYNNYGFV